MSVMYRYIIGPVIVGMLAFLFIYYVSPVLISEPGIVPLVARFALNSSNLYFESTPPVIADYIARLNLTMAALTVGLLLLMAIPLVVAIWDILSSIASWIISCVQRDRKKEEPGDMQPIDMDSSFKTSSIGKGVYGRGLDTIDPD
jgi:hypothetical protein